MLRYKPLTREEVISVVEGKGAASRVPVALHFWTHEDGSDEWNAEVRRIKSEYPQDMQFILFNTPSLFDAPADDPSYRWMNFDRPTGEDNRGMDAQIAMPEWDMLPGVLADFPSPNYPGLIPANAPAPDSRYRVGNWWYGFFERHWLFRGMTNALMDFYTNPEEVHALYTAFADFYVEMMKRGKRELGLDAILFSDDIGMQTGGFFSSAMFDEFFAPYYGRIFSAAHELGMHIWLHCCGCITDFIPKLIDLGLDVLHPIQKYTMDEKMIAREFGGKICLWNGFDVQQIIPWGTPEEVRQEVRYLFDTFQRPEGRLLFTAGNGIHEDCSIASLEALYSEAFEYGLKIGRNK